MAPAENQKILVQVREFAKSLYLIDPKDLERLLKNVEYFPEEGILQTLELLTEASAKQNELLRKLTEKDPTLNTKLKHFLHKEYQSHAKDFELSEHESAAAILNEI